MTITTRDGTTTTYQVGSNEDLIGAMEKSCKKGGKITKIGIVGHGVEGGILMIGKDSLDYETVNPKEGITNDPANYNTFYGFRDATRKYFSDDVTIALRTCNSADSGGAGEGFKDSFPNGTVYGYKGTARTLSKTKTVGWFNRLIKIKL